MKKGRFIFGGAYKLLPDGTKERLPFGTFEEAMANLENETQKIEKMNVFKNLGKPVPQHKRDSALAHVKEMMPDADPELQLWIVGKAASLIEKDMLFSVIGEVEILDKGLAKLDLTGRYRLAAVLLT